MPFAYKILSTKPPGEQWYPDVEPEKHASYMSWVESYPGIIRFHNRRPTPNEHLRTLIFVDKAAYDQFVIERDQRPDYKERIEWLAAHNFVLQEQIG